MNGEEAKKILANKWVIAENLMSDHKEISHLLQGAFLLYKFNVYELPGGIVVSRPLIQDPRLKVDSTIGIICPGEYTFDTGDNAEHLIVLEGRLIASVNDGPKSTLEAYAGIIAPAGNTLNLKAEKDVFYLCQYEPKR